MNLFYHTYFRWDTNEKNVYYTVHYAEYKRLKGLFGMDVSKEDATYDVLKKTIVICIKESEANQVKGTPISYDEVNAMCKAHYDAEQCNTHVELPTEEELNTPATHVVITMWYGSYKDLLRNGADVSAVPGTYDKEHKTIKVICSEDVAAYFPNN